VIIEFLVTAVIGLVQGLADAVLPTGSALPFTIPSGVLAGYTYLNAIAPLGEIIAAAGVLLAVDAAIIGLRLILTIRHAILP
jgi:hypothetical protein